MSTMTGYEIAAEHCAWARGHGFSARQVVEGLLNRPVKHRASINWSDAITAVCAWWEAINHQRLRAAA